MRTTAIQRMRDVYERNEKSYIAWSKQRKLFNQRKAERYYYRKGVNRQRRQKLAEKVLADFPRTPWRETCEQTGGCKEIIWEFGLWETPHDPYYMESGEKWKIFNRLRKFPDEIKEALDDPYVWSMKISVKTSSVRKYVPEILDDIGAGKI